MQITRIPRQPMEPELVRVAAYARVSADKEMAFHSLDAQVDNYERYICYCIDCRCFCADRFCYRYAFRDFLLGSLCLML